MDIISSACDECIHTCVCSIKEYYEERLSKISDITDDKNCHNDKFMVIVRCRHFSKVPTSVNFE